MDPAPASFELADLATQSVRLNSGPRRIVLGFAAVLLAIALLGFAGGWGEGSRSGAIALLGVFGFFGGLMLVGGLFGRGVQPPVAVVRIAVDAVGVRSELGHGAPRALAWADPSFYVVVDDVGDSPFEGAAMRQGLRFWVRAGEPQFAQSAVSIEAYAAVVGAALARGLTVERRVEQLGARSSGGTEPVRRVRIHPGPPNPSAEPITSADLSRLLPIPTYRP